MVHYIHQKTQTVAQIRLAKEKKSKGGIASIVLTKHLPEHREGGFYGKEKNMEKKST